MYDDKVREFVENIGLENIGKRLINNREKVEFVKPEMKLDKLLAYGQLLVDEQARRPGAPCRLAQGLGWAVAGIGTDCVAVHEELGARACLGPARHCAGCAAIHCVDPV